MDRGVIVVTGASRGIGAATARLAATRGYAVCVNYLRQDQQASSLVAEIQALGGRAVACQADVASTQGVVQLFACADQLGRLVALVNNAGVIETQARVEELNLERLQRVFAVNVFGSFLCAQAALKRLSTRHGGLGGSIVNVSSAAARLGSANEYVDYAASKGAIDTFTLGLAKEVAAEGVRVNAVRPGLIYTDMHADGGEPERVERLKTSVPMQRGGHAVEVASAILWLLSDEASFVTGALMDVSGGR